MGPGPPWTPLQILLDEPWFAGWHWCGYVENTGGRGWGLKDPWDEPYRCDDYHGI